MFVLFVGVELVGLKNNFAVDEHDQFNVPVEFVNRNYQEGDRIVLSDMMWYLSYVYYDQTDAQLQLYTPPKPDGTPTRPNAYGFGTLVDQDGGRIYLDQLVGIARRHPPRLADQQQRSPGRFRPTACGLARTQPPGRWWRQGAVVRAVQRAIGATRGLPLDSFQPPLSGAHHGIACA